MLTKYLLFLLLLAVAYGRISIRIRPGRKVEDISVDFKGSDTSVISDKERKTFKLSDEALKKSSEKIFERPCDHIYLKPPSPYGDAYADNGWDIVQRTTTPVRARVLGINSKPVAVASAEYVNNHKKVDVTFSTTVTQQVEETVAHTWSKGGELSIGQEISYSVNFGVASAGGTTSLSYSSGWGEDKTESRTVTLGTTSGLATTIPPGGKVVAVLTASKGTLEFEVDYVTTINNGDVHCRFDEKYKKSQNWAFSLRNAQIDQKLPMTVNITEKISLGFYSSARIEVHDGETDEEIQEEPAGIIDVGPQKVV